MYCLVQVKSDILGHEHSFEERVPVLHVFEPVNYRFALGDNAVQLLPKGILPDEASLKLYQLWGLQDVLANLNSRAQRVSYLLLHRVIKHIFELVLGFDLLVEYTEGNIFEESKGLWQIIDFHVLVDDVDQELRILILVKAILDLVLSNKLVVRYKIARNVSEHYFINLP